MRQEDMEKILKVGVLLSAERDPNRLLERILECVMELAHCDAGTLYLKDGDALAFEIMRNDTLKTYSGGTKGRPELPPVPLNRSNVCAMALLDNRTICIEDVKDNKDYDFSGPIRYDAMTGYNTRSMLVVPMRNREGGRIGVIQLINALDENGSVCAFAPDMALVMESVASQAAITIQNVRYMEEIKELFQSFVRVMSSAIDERTPYNASHARHMAECGGRFVDYLGTCEGEKAFSQEEKEEFLMSILLHDIGKLVTPLEVMNKAKRLFPNQHADIAHRLEVIRLRAEIDCLAGRMTVEEKEKRISETRRAWELIEEINGTGFVQDTLLEGLKELQKRDYIDEDGEAHPWIEPEEYRMLSIRKGTLSEEEREIMEEHVSVTDRLLSQIHFSGSLSHVREWASAHHEFLNGTGYPKHKRAEEIPYEVRMITILDIFDSLVADDRPYKRAMPVDRALSILKAMAEQEGKLDLGLTELFIKSRCWEAG